MVSETQWSRIHSQVGLQGLFLNNKKHSMYTFIFAFIIPFILDRFTKYEVLCTKPYMVEVFPGLHWDLAFNRGVTWSLFQSQSTLIFGILSTVITIILCALAWYTYQRWQQGKSIIGELLVLAGGFSNLVDRALYGAVVDFILVGAKGWYWPAFNIADACIVIGAMIMLWEAMKE